jgi:hypothetical protein
MSKRETIQLFLNSKDANNYIHDSFSEPVFNLPQITIPKSSTIKLRVQAAQIPHSFYNVDDINHVLVYEINGLGVHNYTIPQGNYNVNTLGFILNSATGITFQYINSTNTYIMSHTLPFTIYGESTCIELLGLQEGIDYTSDVDNRITSTISINFFPIKNICVLSHNFITNNISSTDTSLANYLLSIPNDTPANSIIYYRDTTGLLTNVNSITNITSLHLRLIDQRGRLIDLNGHHWSIVIELHIISN